MQEAGEEEYVPSSKGETDSEASMDMSDTEHIRFTAAEFAAWVNREGGRGRVVTLINAGRHAGEDEDEQSTEAIELTNWLVPVIPLDVATSLVDLESPGVVTELGVNSYYHKKEDLVVAVGVCNMKQGAETKVVKSDHRRVYFRCRHSDSCPFDLRAYLMME